MRNRLLLILLTTFLLVAPPSFAASKEMIQLQTQMDQIQSLLTQLKQSNDERIGALNTLVQQNTDSVNKVAAAMDAIQKTFAQQSADATTRGDQLSGQVQALNDSVDELKARMGKLSKQMEDVQAAQQSMQAQAQAQTQAQMQADKDKAAAPPADALYSNALRDLNGGHPEIAQQEFTDYLRFYSNTDLAGNAQFYLAELDYKNGKFAEAVIGYDKVLQNYPGGNKAPASMLKKGYAQAELQQNDEAVQTLTGVVQRYPRTIEATQARDKLRRLGVGAKAGKR